LPKNLPSFAIAAGIEAQWAGHMDTQLAGEFVAHVAACVASRVSKQRNDARIVP
jgi:hypothetical protein